MLRKLFIPAIFLIAIMPVNSWAISTTYTFNNTGSSAWNVVHGDWNFGLDGSITGDWDASSGFLTGITGTLTSNNGNTTISILDGFNFSSGFGVWEVSIDRTFNNRTFTGIFEFADYSYLGVSGTSLTLWGGADIYCTRPNGSSCGTRWLGLDLHGPGQPGGDPVAVPEPATFGLMGLGLLGFAFRKKKLET